MKKQNEFNKAIRAVIERVKKLETFTVSQLPDLCKEILLRAKVVNGVIALFSFIVLVLSIVRLVQTNDSSVACEVAHGGSSLCEYYGSWISYGVLALTSFIGLFSSSIDLLSVIVAPKLTILENLASLIKGDE